MKKYKKGKIISVNLFFRSFLFTAISGKTGICREGKEFEGEMLMDFNQFVIRYWKHIAAQNEEELKKYFHENACIRWHNTNEQFNVSEFLRANCDYPGSWSGEVERIEHIGNTIITVTRVWSEDNSFHVTSFFDMTEDKIKALDEYWGDDGKAPQWRIDKNIGKPIR